MNDLSEDDPLVIETNLTTEEKAVIEAGRKDGSRYGKTNKFGQGDRN